MCAAAAVVALVLVNVAETEDDAGLWHKIGGTRGGEVHLLGAILAHGDDVVHDVLHGLGAGAVVVAALIDMAVGEEHAAEPDILGEAETVGLVLVGEHFELVIVELGGGGVRGDFGCIDWHAVHLDGGDEAVEVGACG